MRRIARDTTLIVYPQGIDETTVDHFLAGNDVACDEIEGYAIGARVLFHQQARAHGVELLAGNTVGHRRYLVPAGALGLNAARNCRPA